MKISVAICTWNRAEMLQRTLASLCRLRPGPPEHWELVLVDNCSTDRTPNVIAEFADRLPLIPVHEPRQGHSVARNKAIDVCRGDIIVWTDDDVEVGSDWLSQYAEAIERTSKASFWGGPIRAKFDVPRPAWLTENWAVCQGCFAVRDLGVEEIELTEERLPYGANFAVRAPVQADFRFDESLGRKGGILIGDDELDVLQRMVAAGHRGYWVPGAGIEHLIPAERMTLDYVRRYFVGQGMRLAATRRGSGRSASALGRNAIVQRNLFRLKYVFAKSPAWLAHWIRAALSEGERLALLEKSSTNG